MRFGIENKGKSEVLEGESGILSIIAKSSRFSCFESVKM